MFALNMDTVKGHAIVRANYRRESILELEPELARIASGESSAREIVW